MPVVPRTIRLSGGALACALQVSRTRVAMILRGEGAVTADAAVRSGRYFDTSPWFCMNLQVRFDLDMSERTTPHPAARIRPADVGSDLAWLSGRDRKTISW